MKIRKGSLPADIRSDPDARPVEVDICMIEPRADGLTPTASRFSHIERSCGLSILSESNRITAEFPSRHVGCIPLTDSVERHELNEHQNIQLAAGVVSPVRKRLRWIICARRA